MRDGKKFYFHIELTMSISNSDIYYWKWKSYFSEMNIQYIPHQQLNIAFLPSKRVWIHVSPAHIFSKRINLAIFFIIWLLDGKLFWIRYLNCTRRRNVRQETFFVYRVVHNWTPPVSSFGWIWAQLNPFRISIKFQPRISNLKICMETTAVEKVLSPFSQALQPPKIAKHTISQYWNNYCGNNKICYSGSEKVEANLIFCFNHLIHPLAPIILKPLLHQNFTQSVRKLKITASMPMNN